MKKIFVGLIFTASLLCGSCSDWLDILPKNEQVTEDFWKSKEDVESVLASGYMYLRNAVPYLIDWGELRGGSVYTSIDLNKQKLQDFQLTSSHKLCSWAIFYQILNMANSVIKYAPEVQQIDETYLDAYMNSHLTEAYFLRALTYFYLVRNFKDVPLVTQPYVDDSAPFDIAKSPEAVIITQIKTDIETALATGAAKSFYDDDAWPGATKGRATKWALYALMADVCLWSEDYDQCIEYADLLIEANETRRPAFIVSKDQWFEIFYPGNSNESIFEINWAGQTFGQTANSPSNFFTISTTATYQYTVAMCERFDEESNSVRSEWGSYVNMTENSDVQQYCIWKYQGIGNKDKMAVRSHKDANYIVYRMADIILMKAEALVWKGGTNYENAMVLVNQIRERAGLPGLSVPDEDAEREMLEIILNERDMEFAAEGKRWYDLLRFGRTGDYKYKERFVEIMIENNQTANATWLRSVLKNTDAWFLPISQRELDVNSLLVQNPYYGGTK